MNAIHWRGHGSAPLELIVAPFDLGAGVRGASMGPEALLHTALAEGLPFFERIPLSRLPMPTLSSHHLSMASVDYLDELVPAAESLCLRHRDALRSGARTLTLSGCHTNALGWVSGAREAFPGARIGLVWLDAHGDLHSPWTTPTGNAHGMPLAGLLGEDSRDLSHREVSERVAWAWHQLKLVGPRSICPKLRPEDVLLVDIRDLEPEEWSTLARLRVPHVTAAERAHLGPSAILDRAWAQFADYDVVLVTLDVDCLDAPLVPGTGTPVEGGMSEHEAVEILKGLMTLPGFKGLDICEINPLLDHENMVAKRVARMLRQLWPALCGHALAGGGLPEGGLLSRG